MKSPKILLDRKSISLALLVFGYIWIFTTEFISVDLVTDLLTFFELQLFKGLFFVTVASAGVYGLLYLREKQIEESEQFTDSILETTDVSIAVIEEGGEFKRVNRAFEETFGYTKQEVIGSNILKLIPENYRNHVKKAFSQIIDGSTPVSKEWDIVDKYGNHIPVVINASLSKTNLQEKEVIVSLTDISDQKEIQQQLEKSLHEKEVLLSEVHHRVKNNLAVISGLSQLQAFQEENEAIKEVLSVNVNRIQTIAAVHELLYKSENLSMVELHNLIRHMINERSLHLSDDEYTDLPIELNLDPVNININQAIPCALIINELISNALKKNSNSHKGTITLSLEKEGNRLVIALNDEREYPGNNMFLAKHKSLSKELVNSLCQQLDATFDQKQYNSGTSCVLSFDKADIKGVASSQIQ